MISNPLAFVGFAERERERKGERDRGGEGGGGGGERERERERESWAYLAALITRGLTYILLWQHVQLSKQVRPRNVHCLLLGLEANKDRQKQTHKKQAKSLTATNASGVFKLQGCTEI